MSNTVAFTKNGRDYTLNGLQALAISTRCVNGSDPHFDDVVQEVAVAIWRHRDARNPQMIARTAIIDYLRKHGVYTRKGIARPTRDTLSLNYPTQETRAPSGLERVEIVDTLVDNDPTPDELDYDHESAVPVFFQLLNQREQTSALLVALGIPQQEIARRFGVSESRVSQHLADARRKLLAAA